MHHASHILLQCLVFWYAINGGSTARNAINPEILANLAKNIASVLSPVILSDIQTRSNRSFQSVLATAASTNHGSLISPSSTENVVDRTTNTANYYQPRANHYTGLYEGDTSAGVEDSQSNERLQGSVQEQSYRRQERLNFYGPYDSSTSSENYGATEKFTANVRPPIANIDSSSNNQYPTYHGAGFHKAALAPEPYAGFPGFGSYGHFPSYHHHGHHHPYGGNRGDEPPPSNGGGSGEQNARLENNGTNHGGYGYGSPYFGNHGYHYPYSSFPYGGYSPYHSSFYGHHNGNGNNSSANGQNGYGHGPYHGGHDFYGSPYGYNYGYNNHGNHGSNRQTEGSAENDDQNNSTKNGYPRPYGPPLAKPYLGAFHLHGFPSLFNLLPYDHFHGAFKGGPVVGVGHIGYPIYADPYPIGFPFHYPYGPVFNGKKYLPPKGKPDSGESGESGESAEMTPGELTENKTPERITVPKTEIVPPASNSTRKSKLKISG